MLEVTGAESLPDALELRLCLPAGSTANLNPMLLLETWKKQTEQTWASPEICRTELLTEEKQKFFEKTLAFSAEMWYDIKAFEICAEFG